MSNGVVEVLSGDANGHTTGRKSSRIEVIDGELLLRADVSAKAEAFSDRTDSVNQVFPGYALVNAGIGYRTSNWEVALFARKLFNENYLQNVTAQSGNSGLIFGNPGEPRIFSIALCIHS